MKKIIYTWIWFLVFNFSIGTIIFPPKANCQSLSRDSILNYTASPYYVGENYPQTLASTIIQLNSFAVIVGFNCFILPTPPSQDDYFWVVTRSLAIGAQQEVDSTRALANELQDRWGELQPVIGTIGNSVDAILQKIMSERMKAVRRRDNKNVRFYSGLYKRLKGFAQAGKLFHTVVSSVKNNEELMQSLVFVGGSLHIYSSARDALQILLDASDDESLKSALRDIISIIDGERNNFEVGVSHMGGQLFSTALDIVGQLSSEEYIQKIVKKRLGKVLSKQFEEFFEGREIIRNMFEPYVGDLCEAAKKGCLAYHTVLIDGSIHKTVFGTIKSNSNKEKFLSSFRFLLLVESGFHEQMSVFYTGISKLQDFSDSVKEHQRLARESLSMFGEIELMDGVLDRR
jgi:hypothetical protein